MIEVGIILLRNTLMMRNNRYALYVAVYKVLGNLFFISDVLIR